MNETITYLLHFDRPLGNAASVQGWAQHYVGTAADLEQRLAAHADPGRCDVKLLRAAHAAGIGWQLARTWPGGRAQEARIKNAHGGHRHRCPVCKGQKEEAAAA